MTTDALLQAYRAAVQAELTGNILPFYPRHVVDAAHGGFYGYVENDGAPRPGAPRGVIQVTRILWAYAHAYRVLLDPAYRTMAEYACRDLLDRFVDRIHGGVFWLLDAQGQPLDTQKLIYAQAFAIYAFAEYALATGSSVSLARAQAIFDWIERHAWDETHGGYREGCTRDGLPAAGARVDSVAGPVAFSMNTHLHLLEAYSNLLAAWPDPQVADALRRCLEILTTRVVNPQTGCLGLQFDSAWQPLDDRTSYGHDIEASWLLTEAADRLGDATLIDSTRAVALRLVDHTWAHGRDADGGLCNEGGPAGVRDRSKDWWPQAEAMVGFFNGWQIAGDLRYLDASLAVWRYVQAQMIDRTHGEWFWGRAANGQVVPQQKSGPWKGPYHNGRACMEIVQRIPYVAP